MAVTKHLREQHETIVELTSTISAYLSPHGVRNNVHDVCTHMARLSGTLSVHLNMEDQSLYPGLLEDPRLEVSTLARGFMQEMGGIANTLASHRRRWGSSRAILDRPETFVDETIHLFTVLRKRIDRENRELYPLMERDDRTTLTRRT